MGGKVVKGLGVGLGVAGSCWLGWTVWSWVDDPSDQIDAVAAIAGLAAVVIGLFVWLWPRPPTGNAVAPTQSIGVGQSITVDRSIRVAHQDGGVNITGDQTTLHIDRGGDPSRNDDPRRGGDCG